MNFEQWRHSTRGWLAHFAGKNRRAYEHYAAAYRYGANAKIARHLGFIATQQNKLSEGAYWFGEAARLEPASAETWFNLGFACERGSDWAQAIAAFEKAVGLNPKLDRAWFGMGLAYAAQGKHDDAANSFETASKLQPMHGEAWYRLGMESHLAQRPQRVAQVVEKLKAFDPRRANQLIRDTGRDDLAHLFTEIPF